MRRLSWVGGVAPLLLAFAASAQACSCAPSPPRESLRESDAAIVGRLVAVVPKGQGRAQFRYRVERVYRGARRIDKGQLLSVRSSTKGAACGLPRRTGRRYGLFLTRSKRLWRSGLCAVVSPRRLAAAARGDQTSAPRKPRCDKQSSD